MTISFLFLHLFVCSIIFTDVHPLISLHPWNAINFIMLYDTFNAWFKSICNDLLIIYTHIHQENWSIGFIDLFLIVAWFGFGGRVVAFIDYLAVFLTIPSYETIWGTLVLDLVEFLLDMCGPGLTIVQRLLQLKSHHLSLSLLSCLYPAVLVLLGQHIFRKLPGSFSRNSHFFNAFPVDPVDFIGICFYFIFCISKFIICVFCFFLLANMAENL